MLYSTRGLGALWLVATLAMPVMLTGCAAHVGVGYRYDPYYHDRHAWDDHEIVFYNQWLDETHRDRRRDFKKLNRHDQQEYWTWRHNHSDKR